MIDINNLTQHLAGDLPTEQERIRHTTANLDYYHCRFEKYRRSLCDTDDRKQVNIRRSSPATNFFVNKLTEHLYRSNPVRAIEDNPLATEVYTNILRDNKIGPKWQMADKYSMLGDAVAFQVAGTADSKKPIKINLWRGDQFAVIPNPDDPCQVDGVVTIDVWSGKKRYQVWTADKYEVYVKECISPDSYGKELTQISSQPNPYGLIPFSFVHFQAPVECFWNGSPGNQLREINEYCNLRLQDSAEAIVYYTNPILQANMGPDKDFGKLYPGKVINSGIKADANNEVQIPDILQYIQCDPSFIDATWGDISAYMEHTMTMLGIPESAFNFRQTSGRSGVSILAEQGPLVLWARGRQPQFLQYETELCDVVLRVLAAHLGNHGVALPAGVDQALEHLELTVRYGEMYSELPGIEADRAAEWALRMRQKDPIQIHQERTGSTLEQTISYFQQSAENWKTFNDIFKDVPNPFANSGQNPGNDGGAMEPQGQQTTEGDQEELDAELESQEDENLEGEV